MHKSRELIYQERVFLVLTAIFVSALVTCNLIFQKFFYWEPFGLYRFEISVGILPYPVTFLVTDILSEIYGRKRANQVVVTGFIASLFMLGVVWVAKHVPPTVWSPVNQETYDLVFGLAPGAVFASMSAYLAAQFIDIRIFHFWKRLTKGKHLWLRNNGSTIISQLVDTSLVLALLCATGAIEWGRYSGLLINGFLFKVLVAFVDTPLFYISSAYLRKKMGLKLGEEISEQRSLA